MKKIEFTLEVLILLAIIPLYLLLEMNHGKADKNITKTEINKTTFIKTKS